MLIQVKQAIFHTLNKILIPDYINILDRLLRPVVQDIQKFADLTGLTFKRLDFPTFNVTELRKKEIPQTLKDYIFKGDILILLYQSNDLSVNMEKRVLLSDTISTHEKTTLPYFVNFYIRQVQTDRENEIRVFIGLKRPDLVYTFYAPLYQLVHGLETIRVTEREDAQDKRAIPITSTDVNLAPVASSIFDTVVRLNDWLPPDLKFDPDKDIEDIKEITNNLYTKMQAIYFQMTNRYQVIG